MRRWPRAPSGYSPTNMSARSRSIPSATARWSCAAARMFATPRKSAGSRSPRSNPPRPASGVSARRSPEARGALAPRRPQRQEVAHGGAGTEGPGLELVHRHALEPGQLGLVEPDFAAGLDVIGDDHLVAL